MSAGTRFLPVRIVVLHPCDMDMGQVMVNVHLPQSRKDKSMCPSTSLTTYILQSQTELISTSFTVGRISPF